MMFQEFVNRTALPIRGMPRSLSMIAQLTPLIPLINTELFFVFVLGGEDPIDYVQRKSLKGGHIKHPSKRPSCVSTSPRRPGTSPSPGTT